VGCAIDGVRVITDIADKKACDTLPSRGEPQRLSGIG
jgi:hypothetical protein